ncbi:antitoxin Xre-like helix-turn-helix domain-containing protein [Pseudomonas sp. JDS28PS106]|uniref:antitoxin Xre-like helix-turn-helix domain-containing protein n=1 Tax=Pseudomonas sp. JDS28PS106 TaxID=2497235 RepID=UPI002FD3FBAD
MIDQRLAKEQVSVGLRVALRIIDAWDASPAQACKILRISQSTFRRASRNGVAGRLDLDQQQRIAMVLGIHASLRTAFTNPANVTGFPSLKNDNTFFDGRSPLEVMSQGDMLSLYETFKRIDHLRYLGDT